MRCGSDERPQSVLMNPLQIIFQITVTQYCMFDYYFTFLKCDNALDHRIMYLAQYACENFSCIVLLYFFKGETDLRECYCISNTVCCLHFIASCR